MDKTGDSADGKLSLSTVQATQIKMNERLSKVLALSDSPHDGEALAALRAARTMLRHSGVDLSEVLRGAVSEKHMALASIRDPDVMASLQREVIQLQKKAAQLQKDLLLQQREAAHWRKTAEQRGERLARAEEERDRLRHFVADMSEKLTSMLSGFHGR